MKITIDSSECKGIMEYLKEVDGIEKPTKKDLKQEIQGIVSGVLQSPDTSVFYYIQKHRTKNC